MDYPIQIEQLTKDYGHGRGVFDVSFIINKGEVYGFLGPNGAGKSTTIRHLMGFSKPQKGSTKILGLESFGNYEKFMDSVGYLPGEIALPAGLTGWEFIDMMKKMKHIKDDSFLQYLINKFELDPQGETKLMSLGVKRKLAVVTAFMNDPDILVLDESTSGLDLRMQQIFIEFIKEEKKRGKTILMSSHIFSEVDATCDRIAIIKDGKIVSEFVANDLKHNSSKVYALFFNNKNELLEFCDKTTQKKYFKIISKSEQQLLLNVNDEDINNLIKEISDYDIKEFSHIKETLEDYFMKYYKEDKTFGGV
jgi:ABC-2 type transport system ATP-binding protein